MRGRRDGRGESPGRTSRRPVLALFAAIGLSFAAIGLSFACYPGDLAGPADPPLVLTRSETAFDFSSVRSWAMPDTILDLCGVATERPDGFRECREPSPVAHVGDAAILARVEEMMSGLGLERISVNDMSPENAPDVVVQVGVMGDVDWASLVPYDWWAWWGWWSGWAAYPALGPGWLEAYPCCVSGALRWSVGTVVLDLVVPSAAPAPGGRLPAVWTAVLDGALPPAPGGSADRAVEGVGRAFAQSAAYLGGGR